MKRFGLFASLWLAFACMAPAKGADDAYLWSLRYMLIGGASDSELFLATAEVASRSATRTGEMHELLAEVLADIRARNLPAQESAVNIVRILAAAPDAGRYQTLIASQKGFLTVKGAVPLLRRYLAAHPKPKGEQFVPGRIDLPALRKQQVDAALASRPTTAQARAQAHAMRNLPLQATVEQLFAAAGTPTHVMPRDTRAAKKLANIDVRQIVFYYRGVGRISYELWQGIWKPQGVDIDPLAFEDQMPYRRDAVAQGMPDDASLVMMQLLSGKPHAMRISAIAVHRMVKPSREYLDTAAEVLLSSHAQARDDSSVDAYSWLCNVLNHHGPVRYAAVLERVADETRDLKLRRYANVVMAAKGPKRPAYVPGTVSLDALRAKYPSIYPYDPEH
jgi:hypothetical protein